MKIRQFVAVAAASAALSMLPASAAFASSAQAPDPHSKPSPAKKVNDHKHRVHPRVGCGGGDGTLGWGGWGSIAFPGYVEYDGNVYNSCHSGTVYLYLHYKNFGHSAHNKQIGKAGARQNHKVHFHDSSHYSTYSQIEITACESYKGWHCGVPIHV